MVVKALAVDPIACNAIYAGTQNGVWERRVR